MAIGVNKDQVAKMLAQGLKPIEVALTVGCTPGYISQLLEDEEFLEKVREGRIKKTAEVVELDNMYDRIEGKALNRLEKMIDLVSKPRDLLEIATKMNGAKRRASVSPNEQLTAGRVVTLNIPAALSHKFILDANAQVVNVDNESMITMPDKTFREFAEARKEETNERSEESRILETTFSTLPAIVGQPESRSTELEKVGSSSTSESGEEVSRSVSHEL